MKNKLQIFMIFIIIFSAFIVLADESKDTVLWDKALRIHNDAIVIDSHVDTPMVIAKSNIDLSVRNNISDLDFVKMKEGGLDAVFFAVFTTNKLDYLHPSKFALETIESIHRQIERNSDIVELAVSSDDIRRINRTGKKSILIGMENGSPVEESLDLLRIFYRLGVRYITLTHNRNNNISDSSTDEDDWYGLSPFGIEMVKEMNRLGMMIDVSHISDRAFWDVMKYSSAPVIASHSCVRTICNRERNMNDDMIKALAKNGGVIQINFYSGFLSNDFAEKTAQKWETVIPEVKILKNKYRNNMDDYYKEIVPVWKKASAEPVDINVLIDHIDYVVKLVGIDYVGIGSDFDGASSYPKGLENASCYPIITYNLLKRGYKEEEIKKILGGNILRVMKKVEDVAKMEYPKE
jgi:membrane dipeptidase